MAISGYNGYDGYNAATGASTHPLDTHSEDQVRKTVAIAKREIYELFKNSDITEETLKDGFNTICEKLKSAISPENYDQALPTLEQSYGILLRNYQARSRLEASEKRARDIKSLFEEAISQINEDSTTADCDLLCKKFEVFNLTESELDEVKKGLTMLLQIHQVVRQAKEMAALNPDTEIIERMIEEMSLLDAIHNAGILASLSPGDKLMRSSHPNQFEIEDRYFPSIRRSLSGDSGEDSWKLALATLSKLLKTENLEAFKSARKALIGIGHLKDTYASCGKPEIAKHFEVILQSKEMLDFLERTILLQTRTAYNAQFINRLKP